MVLGTGGPDISVPRFLRSGFIEAILPDFLPVKPGKDELSSALFLCVLRLDKRASSRKV
jgi:hypothetical protein